MKKYLFTLVTLVFLVTGCTQNNDTREPEENTDGNKTEENVTLTVATSIPPMSEILEVVKPLLKEDGIDLELIEMSDNIQPNSALHHKEVDANFFQHVPWMETYNENNDGNLVPVKAIYHAPYGVYSENYSSLEELPDGATIAIPNDSINQGRSLVLLDKGGVLKLREGAGIYATVQDIEENPKNFVFEEVDLLMLARMYEDADAVIMTPAYAMPLGLTPKSNALISEGIESEFAITLVAREDNKDDEAIQKLAERMTGPEVKEFLEENYNETSIPAF